MRPIPEHRVRRGRRLSAAAALWLALTSMTAVAAAAPAPTPDPEEARLDGVFQRFDARRDVVESTLRGLERDLIEVEARLAKLRAALTKAEAELTMRKVQLDKATADLAAQRLLLNDSAAQIYMRGPWSYLNAMLNAQDIGSMVRVEVYSQAVLGDFIRTVHRLEEEQARAEKAHAAARAKALDLRKRTAEVEAEESRILERQQRTFDKRQRLINDLIADFGGLDELRKRGFDIIIRSYNGSSTRMKTLLAEAQQGQDVAQEGEYQLRFPVDEQRITSRFGWRIHPLWGYRSFHTGMDIASDYGDTIVAAGSGRVLDVAYMGAYGLAIVIDHGHSIGTVYAHLSRALVAKGQLVEDGEEIGEVGCSGWCTGSHLHFEIRIASEPQNPIFWL